MRIKNCKKVLRKVVLLLVLLMSTGCVTETKSDNASKPVSEPTIKEVAVELSVGETTTPAIGFITTDLSNKTLIWTSSNTAAAIVVNGMITAVGEGETVITAVTNDGMYTKSLPIKVNKTVVHVTGIKLDKKNVVLNIGESTTAAVTIVPATATDKTVAWNSSNTSVAIVVGGLISGIAKGDSVVTATTNDGKFVGTIAVKVKKSSEPIDPNKPDTTIISDNPDFIATEIISRPSNQSVTVNIVPLKRMEVYIAYGTEAGKFTEKTGNVIVEGGVPTEILVDKLKANTSYFYHLSYREPGAASFKTGQENTFVTQRAPGSTFTFALQGDSHPERPQQYDPELYLRTMANVQADKPDFYLTMGDDFSVEKVPGFTKDGIEKLYLNQRQFLGRAGRSAALFLVNGNHEHAAEYLLDGTPNNAAVFGQNARNKYFSQPAPDSFYTGDIESVEYIGELRDYYAWNWGDALFITIDPYWHTATPIDSDLRGGDRQYDQWDTTLGEEQYRWFKKTLEESKAKYKFVFTHHVLGTGRGGVELANLYEWGGKNKNGTWEFDKKRPGWELPIHQLMAKNGVTIFFQGHDHVFCKQELDGVIYQTLPEPADPYYELYFADAYKTGVKFSNTGHVRVSVGNAGVKVDYIRAYLPKDEINGHVNGEVAYSYTVLSK